MERCNFWKKYKQKPALLTRTCPPGLVLAGPDMSKSRLLVKFRTLRVQNIYDIKWSESWQKHRPNGAAAEGGACVSVNFLIILYYRYLWLFLIHSLYIPYIFPSYVKYVFPCVSEFMESRVKMINSLSKTDDFIKYDKFS